MVSNSEHTINMLEMHDWLVFELSREFSHRSSYHTHIPTLLTAPTGLIQLNHLAQKHNLYVVMMMY